MWKFKRINKIYILIPKQKKESMKNRLLKTGVDERKPENKKRGSDQFRNMFWRKKVVEVKSKMQNKTI